MNFLWAMEVDGLLLKNKSRLDCFFIAKRVGEITCHIDWLFLPSVPTTDLPFFPHLLPFSFLPSLFFQHFLTMLPHPHLLFQIFTLPKGKSFGHFCFREENSNRTFLLSGRKQQLDIFAFRKKTAKGYFQRSYNLFIHKTNVHFGNVLIMIKSVFRTIGSHVRQF